jgi:hypothetical protein
MEKEQEIQKIYAFLIGLFSGMLLLVLIIWILFETRTFIFSVCAKKNKGCTSKDYFNDPGEALANHQDINSEKILFEGKNGHLYYNRVARDAQACFPEADRVVEIAYPQYCEFFDKKKKSLGLWKQTSYNSNIYFSKGYAEKVTTEGACQPKESSLAYSGKISLRWDKNPLR